MSGAGRRTEDAELRRALAALTQSLGGAVRRVSCLFTDYKGYSTFCAAETARAAFSKAKEVQGLVDRSAGADVRFRRTMGDGLLLTYGTANRAVRAARRIQNAATRDGLNLRVGINSGDAVEDHDRDPYGHPVNVAARLESLAPVGGILIGKDTFDELGATLQAEFTPAPHPLELKGIAGPTNAYYWTQAGPPGTVARQLATAGQRERAKQLWRFGGDETDPVNVVAPPSRLVSEFSSLECPDYVYLDRLGDRDSVVEVSVLLARLYPRRPAPRYSSAEFPSSLFASDLVVIGGPGDGSPGDGNGLCAQLMEHLGIPVTYPASCDRMTTEGGAEHLVEERNGSIVRDYGFFARVRNPWDEDRVVVLVHGIHTYGVLGAARAFGLEPRANGNVTAAIDTAGSDPCFYTHFAVDVVASQVVMPRVRPSQIHQLA